MASSANLEELRRLNKCLLDRLTRKQDEFREQNREPKRATTKAWDVGGGSSVQRDPPLLATRGLSSVARKALATPTRTGHMGSLAPPTSDVPGLHRSGSRKAGDDVIRIRSSVKRLSGSVTGRTTPDLAGGGTPTTRHYLHHLTDEGNVRAKEPRTPKSILITPNRTPKRDPGHVTFLSSPRTPHSTQWTGRPLLGYDWIAGLLEANSGVTNKPEEFFSEIGEFRRVNREECVHDSLSGGGPEDSWGSEEELDVSLDSHQCVYCYRVNSRLFTSPVGAESACPVCKKRRGRRRVTLDEPAFIRVSIPRSTLLPPYKYRAHRRKSFDPTDTLALPSHCLSGWENAVPSCGLRVSSLDLKTSLGPGAAASSANLTDHTAPSANMTLDSTSYYASRARSENLLNLSRSINFHHGKDK